MTDPNPIRVRDATPDDIPALVRFNLAMAAETEDLALDEARLTRGVQRVFDDPDRARYFVAETGSAEVVACTMLTTEWSDWRDGVAWWLQSVYVLPEWRRQGVFRALYQHIERAARSAGDPEVVALRLYVHDENERAQQVYRRLGMDASDYRVFERDYVLNRSEK